MSRNNRSEDTSFYADYDNETGLWCVFGDNTGFAYSSHADEGAAVAAAAAMNNDNDNES